MIDRGAGIPIVLIPGLPGRWEWIRPGVEALSQHHRVVTFSLCDEHHSQFPCAPEKAFENYVSQVEIALDRAGLERAVIAGVSYGGLIATEFAARHPGRLSALILASALHRSWEPDQRQRRYLASPILMSPLFAATAPGRIGPELVAAFPAAADRLRFNLANFARVALAPTTPVRMARRISWAKAHRFLDPSGLRLPTLLVTGEPGLDRVLSVNVTRRYLDDFEDAEHVVLEHTGHFGILTRPQAFAGVFERFLNDARISA